MSNPDGKEIVVRVEVHIPYPGQTVVAQKAAVPEKVMVPYRAEIYIPSEGGTARVRDSGGRRCICATGKSVKDNKVARAVFAQIFQGPDEQVPELPPPGCLGIRPASDGSWIFPEVCGAVCNALPPGADNTLAIWSDYGDELPPPDLRHFKGECAALTDCEFLAGSGYGGGATDSTGRVLTTTAGQTVLLPSTLRVTFTKGKESAACLNTKTVPVFFVPKLRQWEGGFVTIGKKEVGLFVKVRETRLQLEFAKSGGISAAQELLKVPTNYQPLVTTYQTTLSGGYSGDVTITVTDE